MMTTHRATTGMLPNANANAHASNVTGSKIVRILVIVVPVTVVCFVLATAFAMFINSIEKAGREADDTERGVTETWWSHDGRSLLKDSIIEENVDRLVRLVVRYHIDRLDDQGACNSPGECLKALESIDPRFYATEYMREKLFPEVYQNYVGILALLRVRKTGIAHAEPGEGGLIARK